MNGLLATKDGKNEQFVMEVLAIPGETGNPAFTVHIRHPGGDMYSQSGTHEKASILFERLVNKAKNGFFDPTLPQYQPK